MSEMTVVVEPMKLWPFDSAPKEYQDLSPHGGDEDYLLFVPKEWTIGDSGDGELPWDVPLDHRRFGCCSISRHEVVNGTVFIGAHS